jgi:alkylation response protein AidB-like acyl-CoA dehydrogenase
MEIALEAVRIQGGYGYSTEFDVERYLRDAPSMIVGEGATRSIATTPPGSSSNVNRWPPEWTF